jgi:hypothetical protein
MALSSQSKSPFFHSKNQILQPDIPHIYASPKTIQFHHTLNALEVQRKYLKSESKKLWKPQVAYGLLSRLTIDTYLYDVSERLSLKLKNTKACTCMEQDFLTPTNVFQL